MISHSGDFEDKIKESAFGRNGDGGRGERPGLDHGRPLAGAAILVHTWDAAGGAKLVAHNRPHVPSTSNVNVPVRLARVSLLLSGQELLL